jgi:hypothetical protein
MGDLLFFVAKCYMHIFIVENQQLRHLIMHQNPRVMFPNWKQMVQHAIISLVAKTMDHYIMPALDFFVTTIVSFYLWMSRSKHDTFTLVINFINP